MACVRGPPTAVAVSSSSAAAAIAEPANTRPLCAITEKCEAATRPDVTPATGPVTPTMTGDWSRSRKRVSLRVPDSRYG